MKAFGIFSRRDAQVEEHGIRFGKGDSFRRKRKLQGDAAVCCLHAAVPGVQVEGAADRGRRSGAGKHDGRDEPAELGPLAEGNPHHSAEIAKGKTFALR